MNLLLDTHALLWWRHDLGSLTDVVREALTDADNTIHISVVNAWEIQIKAALNKLIIEVPLPELIETEVTRNSFRVLSVTLPHVFALDALPQHHRDPV